MPATEIPFFLVSVSDSLHILLKVPVNFLPEIAVDVVSMTYDPNLTTFSAVVDNPFMVTSSLEFVSHSFSAKLSNHSLVLPVGSGTPPVLV